MIKLFQATDKDFSSNGDIVIKATRAVVHKVDNGEFYLELECGLEYSQYMQANNIIVVPTPQGEQAFRLRDPIESTGTKIRAKLKHVFYDGDNYLIADSYVVDKTCEQALEHLNAATDNESPFSVSSNVSTIRSFRCVRKPLSEAVGVVLERWGGHLVRDNFNIAINNTIGQDNGVIIQYKKNLKEITVSEDWSGVCTKVLPVGADGLLLPELYIYAPTQYDTPFTKSVSFDQSEINPDDYESEEAYTAALVDDLRAQATNYLSVAQYPAINYTISANIEKITDVGDIVQVEDERLGVSLTAQVISFEYNCILGKYESVEFGTLTASLGDLMSGISTEINEAVAESTQAIAINLQAAIDTAESRIWQALGSSYCIFSGDALLVVDKLPASEAVNCLKIDKNGVSFSSNGILGDFITAWTIDGELDFSKLYAINFSASLISGGILERGQNNNACGRIVVYNEQNEVIATLDKDGLRVIGSESFFEAGANGFFIKDKSNNIIISAENGRVIMKKAKVESNLSLFDKLEMLPIEKYNGAIKTSDGVGIFSK